MCWTYLLVTLCLEMSRVGTLSQSTAVSAESSSGETYLLASGHCPCPLSKSTARCLCPLLEVHYPPSTHCQSLSMSTVHVHCLCPMSTSTVHCPCRLSMFTVHVQCPLLEVHFPLSPIHRRTLLSTLHVDCTSPLSMSTVQIHCPC